MNKILNACCDSGIIPSKGRHFIFGGYVMHLKELIVKVLIIAAAIGLIWFIVSKFSDASEDSFGTVTDRNSSQIDYVENY